MLSQHASAPMRELARQVFVETLQKFNSFPLFDKLGDAMITGPTGNNVRDLRVLLAY